MRLADTGSRRVAAAEMVKRALVIGAEIARLEQLTLDALREEWRLLHQTQPPRRLSRDILLRGLTYKLQEAAFGGLPKAIRRMLQAFAFSDCRASTAALVQAGHASRARMARGHAHGRSP